MKTETRRRKGWSAARLAAVAAGSIAVVSALCAGVAAAGRAEIPEPPAGVEFRSPDHVVVMAFRFAPGPLGTAYLLVDPREMDLTGGANREKIAAIDRVYLYAPDHPQYGTPQRLSGRQAGADYQLRNLRFQAQHEGVDVELVMDASLRTTQTIRYLAWELSGRMTVRKPPHTSVFMVARASDSSRFLPQKTFPVNPLFDTPHLELRAMEGGRRVVANLTMAKGGDSRGRMTYILPMQGADAQIRVDALNAQGHVIETLQLRNRRDTFAERDSWTGQFRRLRAGESYTLRATINLGVFGAIEETVNVTVFDI